MKNYKFLLIIFLLLSLSSCLGYTTDDPNEAFKRWTGIPLKNTAVNVLHGRYWQSGHFTSEYEAVFKMIAAEEWVNQLIEFNYLKPSEKSYLPGLINDVTLDWYSPTSDYKMYTDSFSHLYLWVHPSTDTIYIFNRIL